MKISAKVGAAAVILAAFSAWANCGETERVSVTIKAIKCSGKAKGEPQFSDELGELRASLLQYYRGYAKYELLEQQTQGPVQLGTAVEFTLAIGAKVKVTVTELAADRCVADIEIFSGGERVGKTQVRAKPGTYNYAAVSKGEAQLIAVAFKVEQAPAK